MTLAPVKIRTSDRSLELNGGESVWARSEMKMSRNFPGVVVVDGPVGLLIGTLRTAPLGIRPAARARECIQYRRPDQPWVF